MDGDKVTTRRLTFKAAFAFAVAAFLLVILSRASQGQPAPGDGATAQGQTQDITPAERIMSERMVKVVDVTDPMNWKIVEVPLRVMEREVAMVPETHYMFHAKSGKTYAHAIKCVTCRKDIPLPPYGAGVDPRAALAAYMCPLCGGRAAAVPWPQIGQTPARVPPGFKAAPKTVPEPYTKTGWAKEIVHEKTGIEMVFIPAGEFQMGSPENEQERDAHEGPVHKVRITKPFYLGKCEVTQGQWLTQMDGNPSHFKNDDRLPVEMVSWDDCQTFVRKLGEGFRLPTEAQWEYACRAGTTTPFCFGNTISTDQANCDGSTAYGDGQKGAFRQKTTAAGSFPSSAWGVHDMHGNVWEWCADWFAKDYYAKSPAEDPAGPAEGQRRVWRGGGWESGPRSCRSALRTGSETDLRREDCGFRVVFESAALGSPASTPGEPD